MSRVPQLDPVTVEIARVIRDVRRVHGWSQTELADRLTAVGVPWTRTVVVKVETNKRDSIRAYEVAGLAQVLGVDVAVLMDPARCARLRVTVALVLDDR